MKDRRRLRAEKAFPMVFARSPAVVLLRFFLIYREHLELDFS